eukprot:gene11664-18474_t
MPGRGVGAMPAAAGHVSPQSAAHVGRAGATRAAAAGELREPRATPGPGMPSARFRWGVRPLPHRAAPSPPAQRAKANGHAARPAVGCVFHPSLSSPTEPPGFLIRAMPGIRWMVPEKVKRASAVDWAIPAFPALSHAWIQERNDVRGLDASGHCQDLIRSYFDTARLKFGEGHSERFLRFVFRKASGCPRSHSPTITDTQCVAFLCLVHEHLLLQRPELKDTASDALKHFMQKCVDAFHPSAEQRAEQEAACARVAGGAAA